MRSGSGSICSAITRLPANFTAAQEHAVSDEEIKACIATVSRKSRQSKVRKQIPLKEWKFRLDAEDVGVKEGYFAPGYDDSQWEEVETPHSIRYIPENPLRFGRLDCNLVKTEAVWQATYDAWYRTGVGLDALKENETAYLSFESVNQISTVWLNDNPVMLDHVGLFPYKVDVGDELQRKGSTTGRGGGASQDDCLEPPKPVL